MALKTWTNVNEAKSFRVFDHFGNEWFCFCCRTTSAIKKSSGARTFFKPGQSPRHLIMLCSHLLPCCSSSSSSMICILMQN